MDQSAPQINIYKKKLLANARAIITNQIALPLGAVKMNKILYWAQGTEAFTNIDLKIFDDYTSQFNGSPVGAERLLWDKDALKVQDKFLDQLTDKYRDQLIDKCFEIIELLVEH